MFWFKKIIFFWLQKKSVQDTEPCDSTIEWSNMQRSICSSTPLRSRRLIKESRPLALQGPFRDVFHPRIKIAKDDGVNFQTHTFKALKMSQQRDVVLATVIVFVILVENWCLGSVAVLRLLTCGREFGQDAATPKLFAIQNSMVKHWRKGQWPWTVKPGSCRSFHKPRRGRVRFCPWCSWISFTVYEIHFNRRGV